MSKRAIANEIQFGYSPVGQLTSVVMPQVPDPEGSTPVNPNPAWTYEYEQLGQLGVIRDAKNRPTTNSYDFLGRQITRRLPMSQTETNIYDSKGRLWKHSDFKRQRTE